MFNSYDTMFAFYVEPQLTLLVGKRGEAKYPATFVKQSGTLTANEYSANMAHMRSVLHGGKTAVLESEDLRVICV